MKKSQFVIRKFHKNEAIITIMFYPDKRAKLRWAIPKGNMVDLDGGTYRCDTEKDDFGLIKGVPTFCYFYNQVEPVAISKTKPSLMTSSEFNVAINNKVVQEIFLASNKKMDIMNMILLGGVALIVVIGIGFYFLFDKMSTMATTIENLKALIEQVTGGGA